MNNKAFTLIELIMTFALASIIIILLINTVLIIKDTYSKTNVRTELLINQGNLSKLLNEKINRDNLDSYEACSDSSFCYIFKLVDGDSLKLVVKEDSITVNSFVYKLLDGTKIVEPTLTIDNITVTDQNANNSILNIKIPITTKLYPNEDFGINLIYQYNSNKITL